MSFCLELLCIYDSQHPTSHILCAARFFLGAQAAKLTTATLPIARVKSLCAQCKGPLGALSLSPNTLIFDEYVQVVAAFAAYHQPDAYAPFEVRCDFAY